MGNMEAFILAGGRGKRMGLLCRHRAKPMLPFAGSARVIDFPIANCIESGIEQITVCTDYQRGSLEAYLRSFSPKKGQILIESASRPHRGSADAVYQSLDSLKRSSSKDVLILCGDHIYDMDYRLLAGFHRKNGACATIALIEVPIGEAHRFGVISCSSNGKVTAFTEKPKLPESNLVSMGVYIFNRQLLVDLLSKDGGDLHSSHDFGHDIIPGLVGGSMFGYKFDGYWRDIGTPGAYFDANLEFLKMKSHLGSVGFTDSIVSDGCIIEGKVHNSVLSPGVRVERGAMVTNSIIMSNSHIGGGSIVSGSIIDENVTVGSNCYIGLGPAERCWQGTIIGNGASIPSRTIIGADSVVSESGTGVPEIRKPVYAASSREGEEIIDASQSIRTS